MMVSRSLEKLKCSRVIAAFLKACSSATFVALASARVKW